MTLRTFHDTTRLDRAREQVEVEHRDAHRAAEREPDVELDQELRVVGWGI